jgi:hypothetical protein
MLFLFGLSVLGKLYFLATGNIAKRTAKTEALDVLIHSIIIIWTVVLLIDA